MAFRCVQASLFGSCTITSVFFAGFILLVVKEVFLSVNMSPVDNF